LDGFEIGSEMQKATCTSDYRMVQVTLLIWPGYSV